MRIQSVPSVQLQSATTANLIAIASALLVISSVLLTTTAALVVTAAPAWSKSDRGVPLPAQMSPDAQWQYGIPARIPGGAPATPDTVNFGYFTVIGGNTYAVQGDTWTFDHDPSQPFEGWYCVDESFAHGTFFRQITQAIWSSDPNNVEPAPIIDGAGSAWVGLFESSADSLCWSAGLGYGNYWCQNLDSPTLQYSGTGSVTVSFKYFANSELNYDYTHVFLKIGSNTTELNKPGFTSTIGTYDAPAAYSHDISQGDFGGAPTPYTIEFEFTSDYGWSDEDGYRPTTYGPFCVDDVSIGADFYDFEDGLQGWTPSECPGIGSFFTIADVGSYSLQNPCTCRLRGNVMGFADGHGKHPVGEVEGAHSPPVDRSSQYLQSHNEIFAEWDSYADLPKTNGVFYRPGWCYYPYICPVTGRSIWTTRVGQTKWFYVGNTPECFPWRTFANLWGIPPTCQDISLVYELYSSCDAFGIPPSGCSGVTNFSPIIDNVRIRMTTVPNAPVIGYGDGTYYQDGFGQELLLSTTNAGNADVVLDLRFPVTDGLPVLLGDSLSVAGPRPTASTQWLSNLWFRLRREGPGNSSIGGYSTWKNRVTRGLPGGIVGATGNFTWGIMDSVRISGLSATNKFFSNFNELDNLYIAPNGGKQDAIIPDHILGPGTQIEYFVTSYYVCTPSICYTIPDTTGRFYSEFEILPSYRKVSGVDKFPLVLYVDAANLEVNHAALAVTNAQFYVERALNAVVMGAPPSSPIPNPAPWDRFDYLDATSNWHGCVIRNHGDDGGAPLQQLLGYQFILCETGTDPAGSMDAKDWKGFGDWLSAGLCGQAGTLQGLMISGDRAAPGIAMEYPALLTILGASVNCAAPYWDPSCANDPNGCVMLDYCPNGPWTPSVPSDLWGNGCPQQFGFTVLGTSNGGAGNRTFDNVGTGKVTPYAEVTMDGSHGESKYRSVLDGYSLMHLTARDLDPNDPTQCPSDTTSIVTAVIGELHDAIDWTLNISDPTSLQKLNTNPCLIEGVPAGGADDRRANRLDQNSPNPFNPRTAIPYSLATAGPIKLVIFDAAGREVRTLVDGPRPAGSHREIWDGTDNAGRRIAAGVYWSQLTVGGYRLNKKMVVVK